MPARAPDHVDAGIPGHVERAVVAELARGGDARGGPAVARQQDADVPGRAVDDDMRRRIGDAGRQQRGAGGGQHAQRIDREVADRDRDRHHPARRQAGAGSPRSPPAEGGGVGLGRVQEIGRQVDHVVAAAAGVGERTGAATRTLGGASSGDTGPRPRRRIRNSSGSGSSTRTSAAPRRSSLGGAEAAGRARQQHARMRDQLVRQRVQRRRRIVRRRAAAACGSAAMRLPSRYRPKLRGGPSTPSMPALLEMSVSTRSVKSSSRA